MAVESHEENVRILTALDLAASHNGDLSAAERVELGDYAKRIAKEIFDYLNRRKDRP